MPNTNTKSYDTINDGIIAGLVGSLGDALIHAPAYLILGTSMTAHYISQLIFPFEEVTIIRFLIGFFTHFLAGAIVGITLALVFKFLGKDYPYLKGIGLGILLWVVHVVIIPNIVDPRPYLLRTPLESIVDLIAHTSYGIFATTYLLRVYPKKL
ncbi:MAG: hypothetical protein VR72_09715 [Clostridiaceae bacterium BRH_c20a]|nr:MAG: hypothetical protein VR72_09715 [Clostridiaceae bacterium BRH_c20a]